MGKYKLSVIFLSISIIFLGTISIPKVASQGGKPPCCLYYPTANIQTLMQALGKDIPMDFKILGVVIGSGFKTKKQEISISISAVIDKVFVKDLRMNKRILNFVVPDFIDTYKFKNGDYIVLIPYESQNEYLMYDFIRIPKEMVKKN